MRLKKIVVVCALLIGVYLLGTFVYLSMEPALRDYCPVTVPGKAPLILNDPADPQHTFKTINDASCLNETRVYDIVAVKTIDDIKQALARAREKKLSVSIAAVRHSMGGQAFFDDALVLDMRSFNRIISLDQENNVLTVESGATWHQIQLFLHEQHLSVKAMQSTDIFSVGGSLSVNAHGMDHTVGSIASTVRSFTIMLADGTVRTVSRQRQPDLFNAVIGGYGLFGVVLEVALEVTPNVMYKRDAVFVTTPEFPAFADQVVKEHTYGLFYAHLSTSPFSFFQDLVIYGYRQLEHEGAFEPLSTVSFVGLRRFLINLSKRRRYAQVFKWLAEKYIDPLIDQRRENNILSRNQVMHDSVEYLENVLIDETDILHEYFIPRRHFVACIKHMGALLKKSSIPVLNASVRMVYKEDNLLNYAPEDMFALVLYLNQKVTVAALHEMETLTRDLIDVVLQFDGTFFLPYQLYFTKEQLRKAYPMIDDFFALKRYYDPDLLFMNNFYAQYAR